MTFNEWYKANRKAICKGIVSFLVVFEGENLVDCIQFIGETVHGVSKIYGYFEDESYKFKSLSYKPNGKQPIIAIEKA